MKGSRNAQLVSKASFTLKVMFSKVAQNVAKNLGYFFTKIYDQKLLKIAQSVHTGNPLSLCALIFLSIRQK